MRCRRINELKIKKNFLFFFVFHKDNKHNGMDFNRIKRSKEQEVPISGDIQKYLVFDAVSAHLVHSTIIQGGPTWMKYKDFEAAVWR